MFDFHFENISNTIIAQQLITKGIRIQPIAKYK